MRLNKLIFLIGTTFITCGNVFAVSEYANTIQQNIKPKSFLSVASFPTTAADATFVERVENKAAGYEPYFNRSAFSHLSIEEQDELERMAYRAELQRLNMLNNSPRFVYCQTYPDTNECNGVQTPEVPSQPGFVIQRNIDGLYMSAALTPENITKYNLATHDGGCTPPEYSTWASNDILTSGRYQYTAPAFEKFMITAFRKEGGCVNDPNDRGGYTCYGCASRNGGLCTGMDMSTVTRPLVEDLVYQKMYIANGVYRLPDAFRGYAMWGIFGSGPDNGIKILQTALNAPKTKKIDDATIHAAETYVGDFADAYVHAHEQFYRNIVATDNVQKKFLKGWLNSLELLRPSGCHVVPTNPITR